MNQLAYFPTPLPGEDFRSILYRYHVYVMNKEITDTNIDLFGAKSEFTLFPRGLGLLIKKLPQQTLLSIETIIENHTLLPWFLPFLPDKHKDRIFNEIKTGGNLNESFVGKLAGNKYGRCIDVDIKYCPMCLKEDELRYGTGYIHREHQIAFIHKCNKHDLHLISECCCGSKLGYEGISGECKAGHPVILDEKEIVSGIQEQLIADLNSIISHKSVLSLDLIRQRLFEHLHSKGYLTNDVRTRRKALVKEFLQYYSLDDLMSVGLTQEYIMQRNTVERVLWNDSIVYINLPFLLLLFRFIGNSFTEFIYKSSPYALQIPFGYGPWPCRNKHCPDYLKLVIKRCNRLDNMYRGLTGKFYCPTCESEYAILWSWTKGYNNKIPKVYLSTSKREEGIELFQRGSSIKEIAARLYCSVNEVKGTLSNVLSSNIESCTTPSHKHMVQRDAYRAKVETIIKDNPNCSRYEICRKCSVPYQWLKKFDADWLEGQLPKSRSKNNFDWKKVDEVLSKRVREVSESLIRANPPTRVGTYSILGALSKTESGRIKNYSRHLPRTCKILKEVTETKEDYQLRHLPALVRQLRTHYNYKEVSIETIQSYRRSYRTIPEELKRVLSLKLLEL